MDIVISAATGMDPAKSIGIHMPGTKSPAASLPAGHRRREWTKTAPNLSTLTREGWFCSPYVSHWDQCVLGIRPKSMHRATRARRSFGNRGDRKVGIGKMSDLAIRALYSSVELKNMHGCRRNAATRKHGRLLGALCTDPGGKPPHAPDGNPIRHDNPQPEGCGQKLKITEF